MNDLTIYADLSPLDRANLAPGTLRHYKAAIVLWLAANLPIQELANYANTLTPSGKANLKAAMRIMTQDLINKAKMSNAPVETIQRFLWVMEAVQDSIGVHQPDAERTPHWLSQEQVDLITSAALSHSQRDYIVLAVLLGAGLRREELETLTFDTLSQIPYENKMVDVLTIRGKGDKKRVVPISPLLAKHLREWQSVTGGGRIARKVSKSGKVGTSLSAYGIFGIVRKYGHIAGIENLDPHDCRRSYGRIMYYSNNRDIMLVKNLLGHENVRTTQRYIGLDLSLDVTVFPVMQVSGD
jgi:site-specific recombinase XerC